MNEPDKPDWHRARTQQVLDVVLSDDPPQHRSLLASIVTAVEIIWEIVWSIIK